MQDFFPFLKRSIRHYFKGGIFIVLPQAITIIVGFITLPIVLANVSIHDYGKFALVTAIQGWALLVSAGHITQALKRGVAKGQVGTFLFALLARLPFVALTSLILFIGSAIAYYMKDQALSLMLIASAFYLIVGYLPNNALTEYLMAKRAFPLYAIWTSLITTLAAVMGVIIVIQTHNVVLFLITQYAITVIFTLSLLTWLIIKDRLLDHYQRQNIDYSCRKYGIALIPAEITQGTATQVGNFITTAVGGLSQLAVFSVSLRAEEALRSLFTAAHHLLYADFATIGSKEISRIIKQKFIALFAFATIISFLGIAAGAAYILFFLPSEYRNAIFYLSILGLSLPASAMHILLFTVLASNLHHKELSKTITLTSLVRIGAIGILGFAFGVWGVVWGMVIAAWFAVSYYYQMVQSLTVKPLSSVVSKK